MNDNLQALFLNQLGPDTLAGDPLKLARHRIEGLDKDQAIEELKRLSEVRGFTAFYFGGVLSLMKDNLWYQTLGYSGFSTFVEGRVGMSSSTAYDYIAIYRGLSASGISWDQVKHVGWTKVRLFARYLTADNAEGWVQAAEQRNAPELREYVKKAVKEGHDQLSAPNAVVSTHVDSAGDKPIPKGMSTHVVTSPPAHPQQADKGASPGKVVVKKNPVFSKPLLVTKEAAEQTPITLTLKLYPGEYELVEAALEQAQKDSGTTVKSMALSYICQDYLSSHG